MYKTIQNNTQVYIGHDRYDWHKNVKPPENAVFSRGLGLACPAGFEPTVFRVGV